MIQSKNGTSLVVIATIVTAILILMTTRDNTPPSIEKHALIVENKAAELKVNDEVTDEKQALVNEVATEIDNTSKETASTVVSGEQIAAPDGPFNNTSENVETKATTSTQQDLLSLVNQPIWMDQKLGDFKSVEKGEVVFKMMPSSSAGLQGTNPQKVVTSKSDKFAPTTISENYNYQQMPMYNGGYYIAPMPSYLMRSILPKSAATE